MQTTQITEVVTHTGRLVTEQYLFPETGERIAALLDRQLAAGRYAAAEDPAALADLVTTDLQEPCADPHLRLKYHDDPIPDQSDEEMSLDEFARQAARTMGGVARLDRLDGNVAHLDLSPVLFPPVLAGATLTAAMRVVATADALIIDMRRNGGGDPDAVALVCSYLFDEPVRLHTMHQRDSTRDRQSWTLPYVPGPTFGGTKPVYVLTGAATFSGGEQLGYDLQQLGRATVVGERTRGGAHPRIGFRVHPHLEVTVPVARPVNAVSGTNWEGVGVTPDVEVPAEEALAEAHRLARQAIGSGGGTGG